MPDKSKARQYALDNGEQEGTMDFETTVLDFEAGFSMGAKTERELRDQIDQLTRKLQKATGLLQQTFQLPQNQGWNTLYPEGEKIRNNITKFLAE